MGTKSNKEASGPGGKKEFLRVVVDSDELDSARGPEVLERWRCEVKIENLVQSHRYTFWEELNRGLSHGIPKKTSRNSLIQAMDLGTGGAG